MLLKRCVANGSIKCAEYHSRQALYTPSQVTEKVAETKEAPTKKEKKAKK
jgi:hypothetical protein